LRKPGANVIGRLIFVLRMFLARQAVVPGFLARRVLRWE